MKRCEAITPWGEICYAATKKRVDETQTVNMLHNTGRKDWNGENTIAIERCHPVFKTNLCYFHTKRKVGLI